MNLKFNSMKKYHCLSISSSKDKPAVPDGTSFSLPPLTMLSNLMVLCTSVVQSDCID